MLVYSPRHHLDVGFDTPYEVGPSRPELFHQLSQLGFELGPHRDEGQFASLTGSSFLGAPHLKQLPDEILLALLSHGFQAGM